MGEPLTHNTDGSCVVVESDPQAFTVDFGGAVGQMRYVSAFAAGHEFAMTFRPQNLSRIYDHQHRPFPADLKVSRRWVEGQLRPAASPFAGSKLVDSCSRTLACLLLTSLGLRE